MYSGLFILKIENMRPLIKWISIVTGTLLLLAVLAGSLLIDSFNRRTTKKYTVEPKSIEFPGDSLSEETGRRWASILCSHCHGADFSGTAFFNEPGFASIHAPNLTPGKGGLSHYNYADWVRAIYHGVDPQGRPLLIMPAHDFHHLTTRDLSSIIVYLQTLKPIDKIWPKEKQLSVKAKLLASIGAFGVILPAEKISHNDTAVQEFKPEVSATYGKYLVDLFGCRTCHGNNLSGSKAPHPKSPYASGLVRGTAAGSWTEDDFIRVMHTGETPDGRRLSEYMPWQATAHMSNDELRAVYRYLQSLPLTH